MKKILLFALTLIPFGNAVAVVDRVQQQNAICYVKTNAPDLVVGELPFSCNGKAEKFVAHVKKEIGFLSQTKIIPNFDECLTSLFEEKNMTNVARGVWDLRDSSFMSTNAATASAISDACKIIEDSNSPQIDNPSVRHKNRSTEVFPSHVEKTQSYKHREGYEMGSFSIWHWLIVLLIFSPVILGLAIMGPQKSVLIKHSASGLTKKGYFGYSWTYLLFGWLVPVIRGEIGVGVLHLVLTAFTFGIFQIVMPYLYNKQHMTRLLTSGWQLNDTPEINRAAQLKLGIA